MFLYPFVFATIVIIFTDHFHLVWSYHLLQREFRRPARSDPARQIGAVDLARDGALHHHLLDHLCVWHSDSVLESHHVRLVAVLLPNAARTSERTRTSIRRHQLLFLLFSGNPIMNPIEMCFVLTTLV